MARIWCKRQRHPTPPKTINPCNQRYLRCEEMNGGGGIRAPSRQKHRPLQNHNKNTTEPVQLLAKTDTWENHQDAIFDRTIATSEQHHNKSLHKRWFIREMCRPCGKALPEATGKRAAHCPEASPPPQLWVRAMPMRRATGFRHLRIIRMNPKGVSCVCYGI